MLGSVSRGGKDLFFLISQLGIVECGNRLDTDKHVLLVRGEAYGVRVELVADGGLVVREW